MTSVFGHHPGDRPPQQEDWGAGVTISLVAHAALIGALVWGLHWRSSSQASEASAELWAAIPETAAPPPAETAPPPPPPPAPAPAPVPAPPPPPVEAPKPPDIVTEQVVEKKPPKPPKPTPAPPPPKPAPPPPAPRPAPAPAPEPPKDKLDAKTLQKLHDENLKRMMAQMGGSSAATAPSANPTGTGARNAAPSAGYAGRIIARLKPNARLIDSVPGNPEADVEIRCAPDGTIISRRLTKSSGSSVWDQAVLRAIDATGVLPRDTDGRIPDPIELAWRPQD